MCVKTFKTQDDDSDSASSLWFFHPWCSLRWIDILRLFFFSPQFGYRLHQRGYVLTRARLFAGWSDLQQDYTEAAEEIPNKH